MQRLVCDDSHKRDCTFSNDKKKQEPDMEVSVVNTHGQASAATAVTATLVEVRQTVTFARLLVLMIL